MKYLQTSIDEKERERLLEGEEIELEVVDTEGEDYLIYLEPVNLFLSPC